jgi:2-oxoglutarate ferredoxin oxidoreductase subunit delta
LLLFSKAHGIYFWAKKAMNSNSLICINTKKCIACWQCIKVCNNNVFDKIDLPWHKHAIIRKPSNCENCGKCRNICKKKALSEISIVEFEKFKNYRKLKFGFVINITLFITAVISALSGLLIQFYYHMGNHMHTALNQTSELEYLNLTTIHKIGIVIFTISTAIHFSLHWKWYKNVLMNRKISKNIQVLTFSVIFLALAFTGLIPWIIDIANGNQDTRRMLIEIHDKVSFIFIIYFILHFAKRIKWYLNTYESIKNFNLNDSKRVQE